MARSEATSLGKRIYRILMPILSETYGVLLTPQSLFRRSFSHNFGQGIMPKFSASHTHRSHHGTHSGTYSGTHGTLGSTSSKRSVDEAEANNCNPGEEDVENRGEDGVGRVTLAPGEQLKSAIGVQSELQRSFSSTTRALYPLLTSWLGEEAVPSWIAMSSAEGYFASSSYASVQMSHSIHFQKSDWGSQVSGRDGGY